MTEQEHRDLEYHIHTRIFRKPAKQGKYGHYWTDEEGILGLLQVPRYAREIRHAWDVLEHMRSLGWLFDVKAMSDGFVVNGRYYRLPPDGNWDGAILTSGFVQEPGDDACAAICLAGVAAVEVMRPLAAKESR